MCFALFAWFARAELLTGIAKPAKSKACNECKTIVRLRLVCFVCSDTNTVFQTAVFLILVVRNNKRSSGIDGKTSNCLSRNIFTLALC